MVWNLKKHRRSLPTTKNRIKVIAEGDFLVTRLILIRHGETDYNLKKRYCGFGNPPLNSKGIWQAKKLAVRLKDINVDRVYSSDLSRAYETAKIVFPQHAIEQVKNLREMNFGLFEGLKYEEVIKTHPQLYRSWIDAPEKISISHGEGIKDLNKRVSGRLSSILSEHEGKNLGLVTHGGPIRIILCKALRLGLKEFWQIEQELGALNIIEYIEGSSPKLVKTNDTSHLAAKEGDI